MDVEISRIRGEFLVDIRKMNVALNNNYTRSKTDNIEQELRINQDKPRPNQRDCLKATRILEAVCLTQNPKRGPKDPITNHGKSRIVGPRGEESIFKENI